MTNKEYEMHYDRIRNMLVMSGDYDGWDEYENAEGVMETDIRIILKSPHFYPEYFKL